MKRKKKKYNKGEGIFPKKVPPPTPGQIVEANVREVSMVDAGAIDSDFYITKNKSEEKMKIKLPTKVYETMKSAGLDMAEYEIDKNLDNSETSQKENAVIKALNSYEDAQEELKKEENITLSGKLLKEFSELPTKISNTIKEVFGKGNNNSEEQPTSSEDSTKSDKDAEIEKLKKENEELKKQNSENSPVSDQDEELKKQIADLEKENQELKKEKTEEKPSVDNEELTKKLEELKKENQRLKAVRSPGNSLVSEGSLKNATEEQQKKIQDSEEWAGTCIGLVASRARIMNEELYK